MKSSPAAMLAAILAALLALIATPAAARVRTGIDVLQDQRFAQLKQVAARHGGRLRLGILPLFASQKLMPHLPELRARHPGLHLDIDTAAHSLSRLGEGLDVAIPLAREIDPALYARRLGRNLICPIASRATTEGPDAIRTPADLARTTVLIHRDMAETFEVYRNAIGLPDLTPLSIDQYDSGQLILEAAAAGLGVAFMLESHLADAQDDRLVRLFDHVVESPYSYWFACRPRALEMRPVRIFHDWLVDLFGGDVERPGV